MSHEKLLRKQSSEESMNSRESSISLGDEAEGSKVLRVDSSVPVRASRRSKRQKTNSQQLVFNLSDNMDTSKMDDMIKSQL